MGRAEIPVTLRNYMRTWREMMPDWEIVRWDEGCFDVSTAPLYVRQAYEAKKYAFVADYVRLYALQQMGGVYMDVDVEVVRPLDELPEFMVDGLSLMVDGFMGFEENKFHSVGTCLIGSEKGAEWLDEQLAYYNDRPFILADGSYDMTTNAVIVSKILEEHGFMRNGEEQIVEGIHIYDFHYFSPLTSTRVMRANKNTFAIHHYAESWRAVSERKPYRKPVVNEAINAMVQIKRLFE